MEKIFKDGYISKDICSCQGGDGSHRMYFITDMNKPEDANIVIEVKILRRFKASQFKDAERIYNAIDGYAPCEHQIEILNQPISDKKPKE